MLILDCTRTDLEYLLPDGSEARQFDQTAFAAFELHILQRPCAEADYSDEEIAQAAECFAAMDEAEKARLTGNIIAGLPGAEEGYTLDKLSDRLETYDGINKAQTAREFFLFPTGYHPSGRRGRCADGRSSR